MNKSFFKRVSAFVLAFAMVFSVLATSDVSAATKKVTRIEFTKNGYQIQRNIDLSRRLNYYPARVNGTGVTYRTSNSKIATISKSGIVRGVKNGTVTITATLKSNSKVKATTKVTVGKTVSYFALKEGNSKTLRVGGTVTLHPTKMTSGASTKTVSYSSSNKSVATVTSAGKVTAKKPGVAVITVKSDDSRGYSRTFRVYVTKMSSVSLSKTNIALQMGSKEMTTMHAEPSMTYNYTEKATYTFTSSNKKVVTVAKRGTTGRYIDVIAKGEGTATITVTASTYSGDKQTATCNVTVAKKAAWYTIEPTKEGEDLVYTLDGSYKEYKLTRYGKEITSSKEEIDTLASLLADPDKGYDAWMKTTNYPVNDNVFAEGEGATKVITVTGTSRDGHYTATLEKAGDGYQMTVVKEETGTKVVIDVTKVKGTWVAETDDYEVLVPNKNTLIAESKNSGESLTIQNVDGVYSLYINEKYAEGVTVEGYR